jgi:hypothetical protein
LAAFCAVRKLSICVLPKRSLEYMTTTRFGLTPASLKMSVMKRTAFLPKVALPGKMRYTYWSFCCPSRTDFAIFAVGWSAAVMSMMKGTRRCWARGAMVATWAE